MGGAYMPHQAWRAVLLRDPCVYCGAKPKALDHIHPENYGGADGWPNLTPACHPCNQMKADGSLIWMLWRQHEKRMGRMQRRIVGYKLKKRHGVMVREPIATMLEYQGHLRKPDQLRAASSPSQEREPKSTKIL